MLHLYYGNGKGKTTAAFGLLLRQLYNQKRIGILQFLKDGNSSEMHLLKEWQKDYPIQFFVKPLPHTFLSQMEEQEKETTKREQLSLWEELKRNIDEFDFILLDEGLDALSLGLIKEEDLYSFLCTYHKHKEIVLTGRNPSKQLLDLADYASEIHVVKHPFQKGMAARLGVEY